MYFCKISICVILSLEPSTELNFYAFSLNKLQKLHVQRFLNIWIYVVFIWIYVLRTKENIYKLSLSRFSYIL